MLYLVKRILSCLIVTFGVILITFLLSNYAPGDPARITLGNHMESHAYTAVRQQMGLDRSTGQRVQQYVSGLFSGDLGRSFISRREVTQVIGEAFPVTLKLCLFSMVVCLIIGILLGSLAAYHEGTLIDRILGAVSVAGFSLPHFWLAILLQLLFGLWLKLLPISGTGQGQLYFYVLPALSIGIPLGLTYAKLVRYFIMDILQQPFVKALRGWGMPTVRVFFKHVGPNFGYLLLVQAATDVSYLLGGAVVSETIFDLPGLGRVLINAVLHRDWPVVHGGILWIAAMVLTLNVVIGLVETVVEPRVRSVSVREGGI